MSATFPDQALAGQYVTWLEDGHVDAVIRAGAHSAMIIRVEPGGHGGSERVIETFYVFATRQLFDEYVARHAPGLRAEGLKRFGPDRGVRFERAVGEIV